MAAVGNVQSLDVDPPAAATVAVTLAVSEKTRMPLPVFVKRRVPCINQPVSQTPDNCEDQPNPCRQDQVAVRARHGHPHAASENPPPAERDLLP